VQVNGISTCVAEWTILFCLKSATMNESSQLLNNELLSIISSIVDDLSFDIYISLDWKPVTWETRFSQPFRAHNFRNSCGEAEIILDGRPDLPVFCGGRAV
jgi:hypothetical protein